MPIIGPGVTSKVIVVAIIVLLSNVCLRAENLIVQDHFFKSEKSWITIVYHKGDHMTITLADAQQIKQALAEYLATSEQVAEVPFLTKDHEAWVKVDEEAWIDERNQIHIGLWTLQPDGDAWVLVYRPTPPASRVGYQYLAHLQYAENQWRILSISFKKIYYR